MKKESLFDRALVLALAFMAGVLVVTASTWTAGRSQPSQAAIDDFHKLYYQSGGRTWDNTFWLGTPAQKCPLDLWVYQEIIFEQKPDLIIEAGTYKGGSALFLASMFDLVNHGRVITIDIEKREVPQHPRVTYLLGSSTSDQIAAQVRSLIRPGDKVMVILDSDHSKGHVLNELNLYASLVTPGSYLVVEDTNLNGNPVEAGEGAGPHEAVEEFLSRDKRFRVDARREKFYMTFNPGRYLLRIE